MCYLQLTQRQRSRNLIGDCFFSTIRPQCVISSFRIKTIFRLLLIPCDKLYYSQHYNDFVRVRKLGQKLERAIDFITVSQDVIQQDTGMRFSIISDTKHYCFLQPKGTKSQHQNENTNVHSTVEHRLNRLKEKKLLLIKQLIAFEKFNQLFILCLCTDFKIFGQIRFDNAIQLR